MREGIPLLLIDFDVGHCILLGFFTRDIKNTIFPVISNRLKTPCHIYTVKKGIDKIQTPGNDCHLGVC
jgi:hypothetical protein